MKHLEPHTHRRTAESISHSDSPRKQPEMQLSCTRTNGLTDRYYWQTDCAGARNDGKGCEFWRVMNMKKENHSPCVGDYIASWRLLMQSACVMRSAPAKMKDAWIARVLALHHLPWKWSSFLPMCSFLASVIWLYHGYSI